MRSDFFDNLKLPDFVREYLESPDWYLLVSRLKDILNNKIKETQLLSNGKNLSVNGKVYIGKNCTIGENVVIDGPVYICDDVEIGPAVYLRPGTILCKSVSVGHAAEVKNSLMMEGSKVANHVFLGDSILGAAARMGGHCETANRRFDQAPIEFIYKDKKLATGMDKLGLILGEGSRLGGGVMSAPGTMIGKGTFVATLAFVTGYIPPHKYVKTEVTTKIVDNSFMGELKHTMLFERS